MPMPTVVKGAPVASRIPPHENRAKLLPRVVPDEDPAEALRTSRLMRIRQSHSAASPPTRIGQRRSGASHPRGIAEASFDAARYSRIR